MSENSTNMAMPKFFSVALNELAKQTFTVVIVSIVAYIFWQKNETLENKVENYRIEIAAVMEDARKREEALYRELIEEKEEKLCQCTEALRENTAVLDKYFKRRR